MPYITGKLVVIDGTDGSGKGTQSEMLIARLVAEGKKAELLDFPRYGNPSAYFVEKYLRGEYGTADEVGPYRASEFYALDRYDASFSMRAALETGQSLSVTATCHRTWGIKRGRLQTLLNERLF